jgi:hypothetical protein
MRPRIVLKWVEQPAQFGEQFLIRVLKLTAPMYRLGQECAFLIESDASENRLSAGLEGGEVLCDPIRRHLAIGVGGQDHAIPLASFHQPSLGNVHRRATSVASVCGRWRRSHFSDADLKRQTAAQLSCEARTLIGAIVGEHDNADQRWRNRSPQPVELLTKSAQASWKALFFIFDRDSDHEARSDGRREPSRWQSEATNPCTDRVVKHRVS